jgi:atlastin
VQNRIQEDNLQHLALFSEYGRMALNTEQSRQEHAHKESPSTLDKKNNSEENYEPCEKSSNEDDCSADKSLFSVHKPFQRIEFLVRDWQHFDDVDNLDSCMAEMNKYLSTVLADRDAADLKDTREQITGCFDFVGCYMLTHPGFAVTKKKYTGDVAEIDPSFLALMDRYCQRVFGCGSKSCSDSDGKTNNLIPKAIHGRELTAAELGAYIKAYANLFAHGATHFPEASTMLEATSAANNTNATNLSIQHYKQKMDGVAGLRCSDYVSPTELEVFHREFFDQSMDIFEEIANFGSRKAIDQSREIVKMTMNESYELYLQLNEGRNPLAGIGM